MPLTILGLGPGPQDLLTLAAHRTLARAKEVYLRTSRHPVVSALPPHLELHSFDHLYEELPTFQEIYGAIVDRVWELAQRPEGVLYAVPGHPLMAEATVQRLLERCQASETPIEIVMGVSFLEPALTALRLDPFTSSVDVEQTETSTPSLGLQLVDALQPNVDPSRGALVAQLYSRAAAAQLKVELLELYPPEHTITLISGAGSKDEQVRRLLLYQLDREEVFDHLTCLYLPPLPLQQNLATVQGLVNIVAKLRAPDGCPWDQAQTHASLKPYIIEEAYEALDALERADMAGLQEELGDLLLNILLHCQMASEAGDFQLRDVVRGITQKLLRRHPHVFGDLKLATAQEVAQNWEALKDQERAEEASMLDGLSRSLPALAYARSLQQRLAQLLPLEEPEAPELASLLSSLERQSKEKGLATLGTTLFALAYHAAAKGIDPEEALRGANSLFVQRVQRVEELARSKGSSLQSSGPDERRQLWRQSARSAKE